MMSYADTDVADKAKFYYALMTGTSDPKLKLVLRDMKFTKDSIQQALSSILPGTTEKSNLAKITPLENTIFNWDRVSETTSTVKLETPRTLNKQLAQDDDNLLHYVEHISKHEVCLNINCRLSLRGSSEFERAHAITVHVDPSANYQDVPGTHSVPLEQKGRICSSFELQIRPFCSKDIHAACLTRNNSHATQIRLRPILPIPQTLTFQLDFTNDKKQTFSTKLPSLALPFQQFLLPLPWKPDNDQSEFFTHFWKWVSSQSHGISAKDGIETVKTFEVTPEKFEKIHSKHLHKFLVGPEYEYSQSEYAIFLPPYHHILLRCQGHQNNRLVVSVAMDTWMLLPHVDKLLDFFMSE